MLPQIGKAADPIYQMHDKWREISCLAANGTVYGSPDNLWLEHICQCGYSGREYADKKEPLGTFEEHPKERELFIPERIVICFHFSSPFLNVQR
jgi:hypothetical protein